MTIRSCLPLACTLGLAFWAGCPRPAGTCQQDAHCGKDERCCGSRCINVLADVNNCGNCAVACSTANAAPACAAGVCQLECSAGFGNCNNDVKDGCELALTVASACGGCGKTCSSSNAVAECKEMQCSMGACQHGFADCDKNPANGCEVNTRSSMTHCGGCNQPCAVAHASARCSLGVCRPETCEADYADCDLAPDNGCEAALQSDREHCGSCAIACPATQVCIEGACGKPELVAFGGLASFQSGTTSDEVFTFDLGTKTFAPLTTAAPSGSPGPRYGHLAVWQASTKRMLVWGGGTSSPAAPDLWALDFTSEPPEWKPVATHGVAPPGRQWAASALDRVAQRLYIFGGAADPTTALSDFHVLDLPTATWTQLHDSDASDSPGGRVHAMGAFDAVNQRFVLFGGYDPLEGVELAELWSFEVSTGTWTQLALPNGPSARGGGAFFGGSPLLLFSGVSGFFDWQPEVKADSFSLSLGASPSWMLHIAAAPPPRYLAAAASSGRVHYLFGGGVVSGSLGAPTKDLWSYDTQTASWIRLFNGSGVTPTGLAAGSLVLRH